MTWDELVEKVKNISKIEVLCTHCFNFLDEYNSFYMSFNKNGTIEVCDTGTCHIISENRTPDQMYQIIIALTETKE